MGIMDHMFAKLSLPKLFNGNLRWLEQQQSSILSAAFIITVANIASSIAGLIRSRLLISYFFTSQTSREAYEALLVAFQIPDMLFQLIVLGAVSAAFIPLFAKVKKRNEEEAFHLASVVLTVLLVVFSLVALVVGIFAEPLTIARTGEAFTAEQITIVVNLTRIMLVAQLFFAASNIMASMLQSYQRFIIPAISPILYNIGIVTGVFLLEPTFGIYAAGIGVCLGAFLHLMIQIPFVLKLGFRFRLSLDFSLPESKTLLKLIPPRMLTVGASEVQRLALAFFATSLGNLSYVVIKHALDLMVLPIRLFGVPIGQASLPFLSDESAKNDQTRFKSLLVRSLNQISFFALPASIMLLILRVPLVRLVFGTRNLPWETTLMIAKAVALIALSIPAQAMVQLLIRAFHSLKDTVTPLLVTVITVVMYLLGAGFVVFFTDHGVLGLAVITGIIAIIELILFIVFLNRKIPNIFGKEFLFDQAKMTLATFFMSVFLYLPFRILDELIFDTTKTIELIGLTVTTGSIATLVYIYFSALLDVRELTLVTKMLDTIGSSARKVAQMPEVIVEPGDDGSV